MTPEKLQPIKTYETYGGTVYEGLSARVLADRINDLIRAHNELVDCYTDIKAKLEKFPPDHYHQLDLANGIVGEPERWAEAEAHA